MEEKPTDDLMSSDVLPLDERQSRDNELDAGPDAAAADDDDVNNSSVDHNRKSVQQSETGSADHSPRDTGSAILAGSVQVIGQCFRPDV